VGPFFVVFPPSANTTTVLFSLRQRFVANLSKYPESFNAQKIPKNKAPQRAMLTEALKIIDIKRKMLDS
jgi:TPP-dependent trihydroxycyclohexane-1,2-dione (THcHDO) dehydratase